MNSNCKDIELTAPKSWFGSRLKVVVVGCGGTGSEVIDVLSLIHLALVARGGSGLDVHAFDPSSVRESNIVRQRFWPCDVGQNKAVCLVNRYNMMLGISWNAYPTEFPLTPTEDGEFNIDGESDYADFDILISATDLPSARCKLSKVKFYDERVWLDFGNGKDFGQVILGLFDMRKKVLPKPKSKSKSNIETQEAETKTYKFRHVLDHYPDFQTRPDNTAKSCSAAESLLTQDILINRMVAGAGMNILWKLIKEGKTNLNGCVINLGSSKIIPLSFE